MNSNYNNSQNSSQNRSSQNSLQNNSQNRSSQNAKNSTQRSEQQPEQQQLTFHSDDRPFFRRCRLPCKLHLREWVREIPRLYVRTGGFVTRQGRLFSHVLL